MLALQPPVDAPIARPFHYEGSPFQRGLHRGVDFAVPPGTPVRKPCGHLVYDGARVRTFACGRFRVTLLPLEHGRTTDEPLHLGVRRAGDAFGYVDPAPLLAHTPSVPVQAPPAPGPRRFSVRRPPKTQPAPAAEPAGAPMVAWAALAAAAAAAGGSVRVRLRRRRATTTARAAPEA